MVGGCEGGGEGWEESEGWGSWGECERKEGERVGRVRWEVGAVESGVKEGWEECEDGNSLYEGR